MILFGSRAWGDARENSDVDIVVEAEPFGPERSRRQALVRLYQALVEFPVPAGIPHLPYNPSETETCPAVIARTAPN